MDSQIDLQQPVLDGGIRSINFFNGRLLSARDLTLEQSAYREADRRLGQAVGEGVDYGLEVSPAAKSSKQSPAVSVEAGLAVNRRGQTLMLDARADVALVRTATAAASSKVFTECEPLQTGAYVAGAGVYLLTIAPAQTTEGRATTNGMNPGSATCNSDTIVNAVQFRLIQLDPPITSGELQDVNHLRNLIAYKCFGVSDTSAFIADPFGPEVKQWGLLDTLRPDQLTDCEVPLAVLYWTDDGIQFIDMWSVRRQITRVENAASVLSLLDDRRASEGNATIQQFQEEIEGLLESEPFPELIAAGDYFRYLPPAGILPLRQGAIKGFSLNTFFNGVVCRVPEYIDGSLVRPLLREAVNYEPINLKSGEMIWLYKVRQTERLLAEGTVVQDYVVFASPQVPYKATARFDVSWWDYANYARCGDCET